MAHYYLSGHDSFIAFFCDKTKRKSIDLIYNLFITNKNIVRYFNSVHSDIIFLDFLVTKDLWFNVRWTPNLILQFFYKKTF